MPSPRFSTAGNQGGVNPQRRALHVQRKLALDVRAGGLEPGKTRLAPQPRAGDGPIRPARRPTSTACSMRLGQGSSEEIAIGNVRTEFFLGFSQGFELNFPSRACPRHDHPDETRAIAARMAASSRPWSQTATAGICRIIANFSGESTMDRPASQAERTTSSISVWISGWRSPTSIGERRRCWRYG